MNDRTIYNRLLYKYVDNSVRVTFKSGSFLLPEDCIWFEIIDPGQLFTFLLVIKPTKVHLEGIKDMNVIVSYMEKLENDFIK